MSKFINYQNIDFKLNNQDFYATQISISAQASVSPVVLSDGSLLDYAPNGAVVGELSCDFYLTGALPSFLNITGSSETAISSSFAGVTINKVYPKSLSFKVDPFKPILMSLACDWYGDVKVENFAGESYSTKLSKQVPSYIANAYKSYLSETSNTNSIGYLTSFQYSMSVDRPSYFIIGQKIPYRVAKLNKKLEVSLDSDYLGQLVDIKGKNISTVIVLNDLYGTNLDTFIIDGVLTSQSYTVSQGEHLLSSASIMQQLTDVKTLI